MINNFHKIIELKSVDSTNKYAIKLLNKSKIEECTIIFANSQYSGKGQENNLWESESHKNLTFSMILYPKFLLPEKQFLLNKIISLAVCDFVKSIVKHNKVSIKWPNDIYIDNKKTAGILIENTISGNIFKNTVIGIGLNINQTIFKSNAPNPVSLKIVTEKDFNIKECLNDLCFFIDKRYMELKNNRYDIIDYDYLNCLYHYKSLEQYKYKKSIIYAKITGIDKFGRLILETTNKEILKCDMKDVMFM
jgi:BirA family biotin operon repressor/biotin-[acetyl-CoA-carboxylase] ligase